MMREEAGLAEGSAQSESHKLAEEAATWFVRMREAKTTERERQRFDCWLAASERHRREYASFEKLWGALDGLSRPWARKKRMAGTVVALIAAIALAFAYGTAAVDEQKYTKIGEIRQFTLADGSVLAMDADSVLHVEYSLWRRQIRLERGQAQFKVMAGLRPFEVVAGDGTMRDIGTTFNVREDQGKVSVSVQEGAVEIDLPHSGKKYLLTAGQQASYRNGQISAEPASGANVDPPWRDNRWVFDSISLGEVVREINHQHERPLMLANASLNDYRISGVFNRSDRAGILRALSAILPLKVEEERDETVLRRR